MLFVNGVEDAGEDLAVPFLRLKTAELATRPEATLKPVIDP